MTLHRVNRIISGPVLHHKIKDMNMKPFTTEHNPDITVILSNSVKGSLSQLLHVLKSPKTKALRLSPVTMRSIPDVTININNILSTNRVSPF